MDDIVIDMHSTLDNYTVESIIKKFVEERTGKTVSKIEATVNDNKFTGFSISYHSEIPTINTQYVKKVTVIDKTFKPMIYD